jgi:foldase protein PrsA
MSAKNLRVLRPGFARIEHVVTSARRLFPALGAFFVAATLVAGCGDSIPKDAVASVDGSAITQAQFKHWLTIAQSTSQQGAPKVTYNPPNFVECVAGKRKTAPQTTDTQLRTQCKQEYDSLRDQVMQFLILEKWVDGEAKSQGVKISDKTAEADFEKARKQSFPKEADFQKFLKTSGMTVEDAKFQVRFNTVYTKLREKAVKNADKVTSKEILDFYKKNKARLGTPLTRDLRVVLTRDAATAAKAKAALASGQSWSSVVKKYSIDPATKATGGVLQVQKETPASQQTLKQATPAIRQQLDAQNKQKADDTFNTQLRNKWKAKTNCADAFVMTQCKNAPKEKTATTAGAVQTVPQP